MKNSELEILNSTLNVEKYIDLAVQYGLVLIKAILLLIIGLWVIKRLVKAIDKVFIKAEVDETLRPFLLTIISVLLKVVLIIAVVGFLGVQTSSFVAVLGAAGLAIGLALQGSLSNLAGGVIILLLKPFKVGEVIDFNGMAGTVKEIQIFHTIIFTFDNRRIIIPNAQLANSIITNITRNETRRLDMEFSVAYGSDIEHVKAVIMELIENDARFHKDPAPLIRLIRMADSSLNFVVRVWVNTSDYWPCYFDLNELTYKAFNQKGISIPFPQLDVHLKQA